MSNITKKNNLFPQLTKTVDNSTFNSLIETMPEHEGMLTVINENLPEITRATSLFHKTQSQFMDNFLTTSHPTPLRNARQILAEIQRSKEALKQTYLNSLKKDVEIKIKLREEAAEEDELKASLIQIDIAELTSNLDSLRNNVSGAIRKITNYILQYNNILETHGLEEFTESDFEKEEEKYHIMKAFDQALCAARTHGGLIDEGNMIYLSQIGINGAVAQRSLTEYLILEQTTMKDNKEPTHQMQLNFLNAMYEKFKGSSTTYAVKKGQLTSVAEIATIQTNLKTLLEDISEK